MQRSRAPQLMRYTQGCNMSTRRRAEYLASQASASIYFVHTMLCSHGAPACRRNLASLVTQPPPRHPPPTPSLTSHVSCLTPTHPRLSSLAHTSSLTVKHALQRCVQLQLRQAGLHRSTPLALDPAADLGPARPRPIGVGQYAPSAQPPQHRLSRLGRTKAQDICGWGHRDRYGVVKECPTYMMRGWCVNHVIA